MPESTSSSHSGAVYLSKHSVPVFTLFSSTECLTTQLFGPELGFGESFWRLNDWTIGRPAPSTSASFTSCLPFLVLGNRGSGVGSCTRSLLLWRPGLHFCCQSVLTCHAAHQIWDAQTEHKGCNIFYITCQQPLTLQGSALFKISWVRLLCSLTQSPNCTNRWRDCPSHVSGPIATPMQCSGPAVSCHAKLYPH